MSKSFQKNKNKRRSFPKKILEPKKEKNNISLNIKDKPIDNKNKIQKQVKENTKSIDNKNQKQLKENKEPKKNINNKKNNNNKIKKELKNNKPIDEIKTIKKNIKNNKSIDEIKTIKKQNKKIETKRKIEKKITKKNIINNKKDLEVAIEFNDIFFSYDGTRKTLDNVNFKIYDNEYVCVIGHNGSGKSTISKVLVGLLKPLSGYISIYGVKISYENIKYLRDNVGIIFQNPDSQFIGLTTEDDIAFGLENKKIHPKVMKEIINNVVKIIDIENFLKKDSISLSGGQKQRVAIASVLATNPRIMIFDESTSMLDPKGKKELKETILKLRNEAKKTIISITHDMDEVLNADKVIVMEKGKVKMIGKPSEIFVDEKKLKELALDFPFSLKLSKLLKDKKIINKLSINMDDLVESICKK